MKLHFKYLFGHVQSWKFEKYKLISNITFAFYLNATLTRKSKYLLLIPEVLVWLEVVKASNLSWRCNLSLNQTLNETSFSESTVVLLQMQLQTCCAICSSSYWFLCLTIALMLLTDFTCLLWDLISMISHSEVD